VTRPLLSRMIPLLLLTAPLAFARQEEPKASLQDTFQKGKAAFKLGNYQSSLAAFDSLEAMAQSVSEADRAKLEPAVAFYKGANLAALGQKDAARAQFEKYLTLAPAAGLDPAAYPKSVITLFNEVRDKRLKESGATIPGVKAGQDAGMMADYQRYKPQSDAASRDPKWAQGAIRFLLTKPERERWERLTDDGSRAEFVAEFWKSRDPTPLTPENEFRDEIERRILYADAHFAADEKRGSESDRGLVFVILGPPSYVGQKPLMSDDDPIQAARAAPEQEVKYNADGTKVIILHPRPALTSETLQGTREIWYYRRDRLPKVVKFTEVDFEFITKKGFGTAVLQRDHDQLTTLDLAAQASVPGQN
jgi:GWxTD domain-containing protein